MGFLLGDGRERVIVWSLLLRPAYSDHIVDRFVTDSHGRLARCGRPTFPISADDR
jgi:hypothetical protein